MTWQPVHRKASRRSLDAWLWIGTAGLLALLPGCVVSRGLPRSQAVLNSLGPEILQAVYVQTKGGAKWTATLTAWERTDGLTPWRRVRGPVRAVVGRGGIASWETKREGDGRTPAGIFSLRRAFGYAPTARTRLEYAGVTPRDFWIDDPRSPQYNQWVQGAPPGVSHERLRRDDECYKYGIVIEYNTHPVVAGKGSAIFLHVWGGGRRPTSGCVAVAERDLLELLNWLDGDRHPVVVIAR